MPIIYNYKTLGEFIEDATQAIEDFILWKLKDGESVSIALSGGNSPKPIYEQLAKNKKIDWPKVELFMVDERYVPHGSNQSNFKMIDEALLSKIPPVKGFYGFNTHLELRQAANVYDEMLEERKEPLFDLVILGMGADGHTASLFPGGDALDEKIKLVTTSSSPDGLARLTLTYPALFSSEKIMFLILGKEKEEMVRELVSKDKMDSKKFPAKMMMTHKNVEVYYCSM